MQGLAVPPAGAPMHHKAPLPADSGDSAQTGKTSSPFEEQQQQWWGGHPHHPLPGAHGGLHTLEGAGSLSSRPHMNALAAKLAIREALAPLSAAELASVQEQLRLSRLARQAAPLTMVGSSSWGMPCEEGSGDAWQLAGAAASSAMTASCSTGGAGLRAAASLPSLPSPSSSSLSSAATGSFGGVVQQVAAALSAGTVAQADVQRVLSSLDPSVLQPAPGAQHVALAQAYQEEYYDYHMHCAQQQQQAAAAAAWRQQPAHGCFPPRQHSCALPITASCATSPGALTAAALSGLQHATQGGSAAAAGAGCADRSRHPGVSPARGRRSSCSGGSSRQARTSPWAPRVLAVSSAAAAAPRQRRPPQAATHGAAAMAVVEQSPWQPSTAGAPSPYGLQARLARLPPAVQAELLAQLEELDAVAEDMRRAAVGGDAGSAEPLGGPRRSGRARRPRDWAQSGFAAIGSRSASPDAHAREAPGGMDGAAQPYKRARLDVSLPDGSAPLCAGGGGGGASSSPQVLSLAGAPLWDAAPEPLTLDCELAGAGDTQQPAAPVRRRRIVRKPGSRASARKAMHRVTFRRGKPQRAAPQ